jgi:hypothetical protein
VRLTDAQFAGTQTIEIVGTRAVAVAGVSPDEEDDFTPWLAGHLEHLNHLGMGQLTCKGVEFRVQGKSLDILAELDDGRVVAIENQYGKANDNHLKRGLEYALGTNAVALILIAQQFTHSFISESLPRLRNVLRADSISVFLVTLTVEVLEGKDVLYRIPRFDVIEPRPIDWPSVPSPMPTITLPEFLLAVTVFRRPLVIGLFEAWCELTDSAVEPGGGNKSMGLWLSDGTGKPIMVMGVELPMGRLWIYRDAIRRYRSLVGSLDDTQVDEAQREWFPSATHNNHFPCVADPTSASVRGFGQWLVAADFRNSPLSITEIPQLIAGVG